MATTKQSPLLMYLIMVLGLVLGFLYNSSTDPATEVVGVPPNLQLTTLQSLDGLRIDYALLESEQFRQLRVFGELPVQKGSGGKDDPFR